jgi:hypothetical protein
MSKTIAPGTHAAPPRSVRNRLAVVCLLAGVVAAAGVLALPHRAGGRALPAAAPSTRPIETLHVGDRVAAHNPEVGAEARRSPDPDPATWRRLTLRVDRPGVCRFDVELLRPLAWLEAAGARVGGTVRLRLPEMGLDDPAAVLAVGPCPAIGPGPGRVVTGTFAHEAEGNLLDVYVDGLAAPIGCTAGHPFWSEDRQAFVQAGDLRAGERLRTERAGVRPVTAVETRPGRTVVYNLEVDAEHAYFVSPLGVLVHNASPPRDVPGEKTLTPEEVAEIQRIVDKYGKRIDVGGSRARGEGRDIGQTDLPADKGPGTRSDIDFILDPQDPQFKDIMAELRQVGEGAGSLHPDTAFLSKYDTGDPRIRFEPGQPPRAIGGGK